MLLLSVTLGVSFYSVFAEASIDSKLLEVAATPVISSHNPLAELNLPENEFGATVFSLLYGSPGLAFESAFEGAPGLKAVGTNGIFSSGRLNQAGDNSVVRPNVDTILGFSVLDISQSDIVLTIPPMQTDRFTLFSFYDPWGDNYVALGSLYWDVPGDYLVRPSLKTGHAGKSSRSCEGYSGCIDSPTLNGIMLARVEVKNMSDTQYVNQYIKQIKWTEVGNRQALGPPLTPKDFTGLSQDMAVRALQLTARLGGRNPPQNPLFASILPWVLRSIGIRDGTFQPSSQVNLTDAYNEWHRILNNFQSDPRSYTPLNNGWEYLSPSFSGSFQHGRNVVARSYIGNFGYLQNTPDQSIYPNPPKPVYTLGQDEAYIFTFSGKPPLNSRVGFWSLTIYDSKGFLIHNPAHVYALGDRSNMTYADGSPVYGGGAEETNRPFEILVQAADKAPPSNWTHNWLPAPAGGGDFTITMRLYGPLGRATDGYEYPKITKRKAVE